MRARLLACALAAVATAAACTSDGTPDAAPSPTASPTPTTLAIPAMRIESRAGFPPQERLGTYRAQRVASAAYPAGLAVAPDGRIFFSELYGGKIRVMSRSGQVDPRPWFDVNDHFRIRWTKFFHGGLSGIAFDPDFERTRFVYAVAQAPDPQTELPSKTMVLRFTERDGRGADPRVLLEIPAGKFDNVYSLVFGPDGMLYVPSGQNANRPRRADPLSDLLGKVLRMTRDGEPPGDNPFGERAPLVYAMGIRNAFDIAFHPDTGFILAGENGTTDHDEIDLIMPGHDYGWPAHRGIVEVEGVTSPLVDYGSERLAPVGIAYYDGSAFPELRGRFLMCHNHPDGMFALRLEVEQGSARLANMTRISDRCRIDVVVGPRGEVYFNDAEGIYRLARA